MSNELCVEDRSFTGYGTIDSYGQIRGPRIVLNFHLRLWILLDELNSFSTCLFILPTRQSQQTINSPGILTVSFPLAALGPNYIRAYPIFIDLKDRSKSLSDKPTGGTLHEAFTFTNSLPGSPRQALMSSHSNQRSAYSVQPLRYSRLRYWSASGALVTLRFSASHSSFFPPRR